MRRRPLRAHAHTRALARGATREQRFPWFAWLVLLTMLVIGAALGRAANTSPAAAPLPPAQSQGFRSGSAKASPGQVLVPPPQQGRGGVITPPASVDRGITQPAPPAQAFPTPVIKPPQ